MDLRNNRNALSSQLGILLVSFSLHRGAESVMIVDQQLQTRQHHGRQTRALEVRVLGDQDVDVVRDRHSDRLDDAVEDSAGVGLVELGCQVGVYEAFAVGYVDRADCDEFLG